MNWVTVVWSMNAAVCGTVGIMFLLVWLHQRDHLASLLFALAALGVGCFAGFELALMRSTTPEWYATLVRWIHVPIWVVVCSLVGFVRVYLDAGRRWLAWVIVATRTVALAINFLVPVNLNFREISALEFRQWLGGENVAMAVGETSRWALLAQVSLLLLFVYFFDATVTVWRRGERRRAVVVGGSVMLFVIFSWAQAALVIFGLVRMPFIIGLPFVGLLAAMAYELSSEVFLAARLAKELQESQQRLVLAAEASRLVHWVWEIPTDEIWASAEGQRFHGFTGDQALGWPRLISVMHPEDQAGVQSAVESALSGDGHFSAEYRVVHSGGTVSWIEALGRTEFDHHHKPLRLRGVWLDSTARKRAEEDARRSRDELTHLSRVTMLGELAGSLAHELRQPLTAILSNAQAAQRALDRGSVDARELHEILDDIVAQDCRAGEVIGRVRLLLRKGELSRQPLDLNEVAAEVVKLVGNDLARQGVTVAMQLVPGLPRVSGDRVQIQQVILNLVMNGCEAMRHAEPGRRELRLSTLQRESGWVAIEIRDGGRGIPAEQVERVFDPFFTTRTEGLGLGLSICRTIVEAHGGTVELIGTSAAGSTFRCTLPESLPGDHEPI